MGKMIIRADDLGFSEGVNLGISKAVHDGLVTSVGMMTNMPAAANGFALIKDADIALGLHTNICAGMPVSNSDEITTLVQANGAFCSSREIRGRKEDKVAYADAYKEVEAQLDRFIAITGREPDYMEAHAVKSENLYQALEAVAKEHGLFFENVLMSTAWEEEHHNKGYMAMPDKETNIYDAPAFFEEHLQDFKKNDVSTVIFHPGYLDWNIWTHSSYRQIRPYECAFLCSEWLKDFLDTHHLERTDFRKEH